MRTFWLRRIKKYSKKLHFILRIEVIEHNNVPKKSIFKEQPDLFVEAFRLHWHRFVICVPQIDRGPITRVQVTPDPRQSYNIDNLIARVKDQSALYTILVEIYKNIANESVIVDVQFDVCAVNSRCQKKIVINIYLFCNSI